MRGKNIAMKRRFYLFFILAALLLGGVGWWVLHTVRLKMQTELEQDLRTILMADVTALKAWMEAQLKTANFISREPRVRDLVSELVTLSHQTNAPRDALLTAKAQTDLRNYLTEVEQRIGLRGFNVISRDGIIVSAPRSMMVGRRVRGPGLSNLTKVFESGEPQLVIPLRNAPGTPPGLGRGPGPGKQRRGPFPDRPSTNSFAPRNPRPKSNPPEIPPDALRRADARPPEESEVQPQLTVMLSSPVKNPQGEVIAAIGFTIPTEDDFTRMLSARFGDTGETLAFNREGVMISQTRFEDQLKKLGLLSQEPGASSVLTLQLLDPGGDLTQGYPPATPRADQPLIHLAARALAGQPGLDLSGFRDYRGVQVVAAWTWLPQYELGIATKVDYREGYQLLLALQRMFLLLMALLAVCAVGFLFYFLIIVKLRRKVKQAELMMRELGQFRLEEKIGEGGMGVVYRARHALLRRPTAIKLLLPDKASAQTIAQFENEVRLTSRLTHPNTIQIYDFGHTTDGIFYYAMEFLEGLSLRDLVLREGPIPQGRILFILQQIGGSLKEAHDAGLVHRDVKPANVFLTNRGGRADWVKVLDFGLVARFDDEENLNERGISTASIAGTPGYMAPEALAIPARVDVRSDIYSVGALGYFLLTGRGLFEGLTFSQIRDSYQQMDQAGLVFPFEPLPEGNLEKLIQQCLEKDPDRRPQNMTQLMELLAACPEADTWTIRESESWWRQYAESIPAPQKAAKCLDVQALEKTVKIEMVQRLPSAPIADNP